RRPRSTTGSRRIPRGSKTSRPLDRAPLAVGPQQKLGGSVGPLAPGGIEAQAAVRLPPGVEDRLDHAPAGFDVVGALKQRRIAEHAVVDQPLVAGARRRIEI